MTTKDAYPIPRIDESLSKLGDAKFFTTLDLGSAFWQVPLRKKDREKTGLACELGLYQWTRMAQALTGVTKKYGNLVMCYMNDVVIATSSLEDQIDWLDEVFGCMKGAGLKCEPSNVNNEGFNQVSRKNGGQAWCEAGPGSSRGCADVDVSQSGHTTDELPRVSQLLP